jgi:hypothetical protein
VLTGIFAVEVFMSEVYTGPFKQFLVLESLREMLMVGVYSDGPLFDFDSDVFGDIYSYLKVFDEFRESSD